MAFILKNNRFLFLCDSNYLTFIGIKCHKSHSLSHNSGFDKSLCKAWQSGWFEMVSYIIVSSANSLILFCIFSGMPFVYMRKDMDPVQILGERLTGLDKHRPEQHTEFCTKGMTGSM